MYAVIQKEMWETTIHFLPSPGSTISTVAVSGNSSTAMTGSESWIWKVSEVSNSWSVNIFTFHVAVVWPGLNWTCFWAFPRKSLSCTAVPSTVAIPEKDRYKKQNTKTVVLLDCHESLIAAHIHSFALVDFFFFNEHTTQTWSTMQRSWVIMQEFSPWPYW